MIGISRASSNPSFYKSIFFIVSARLFCIVSAFVRRGLLSIVLFSFLSLFLFLFPFGHFIVNNSRYKFIDIFFQLICCFLSHFIHHHVKHIINFHLREGSVT
uniref:Uncharacterized protein n=1 Tax=Cacopsylla melanoneura TaxID=428564 RepID=A0A8D9AER2_9HEMI